MEVLNHSAKRGGVSVISSCSRCDWLLHETAFPAGARGVEDCTATAQSTYLWQRQVSRASDVDTGRSCIIFHVVAVVCSNHWPTSQDAEVRHKRKHRVGPQHADARDTDTHHPNAWDETDGTTGRQVQGRTAQGSSVPWWRPWKGRGASHGPERFLIRQAVR